MKTRWQNKPSRLEGRVEKKLESEKEKKEENNQAPIKTCIKALKTATLATAKEDLCKLLLFFFFLSRHRGSFSAGGTLREQRRLMKPWRGETFHTLR